MLPVIIYLSMSMMQASKPISLGMVILIVSFFSASALGLSSSSWYAFILFLIYVGAIMVMFIYVCLLNSNLKFSFSYLSVPLTLVSSLLLSWSVDFNASFTISLIGSDMLKDGLVSLFVGMVVFLFLTLLAVVLVSSIAPLRSYVKS